MKYRAWCGKRSYDVYFWITVEANSEQEARAKIKEEMDKSGYDDMGWFTTEDKFQADNLADKLKSVFKKAGYAWKETSVFENGSDIIKVEVTDGQYSKFEFSIDGKGAHANGK